MNSIIGYNKFRFVATAGRNLISRAAYSGLGREEIMWNWPPEKFDNHFIDYLSRPEIDGWEVRKAFTELFNFDVIPDPKIVTAGLRACRRVNDLSLAVRFLENVKLKCGSGKTRKLVYPYIIQEVQPVLDELGIPTPEDLGYDKPEYFHPASEEYWEKKWYKDYGYTKMPGYEHFG